MKDFVKSAWPARGFIVPCLEGPAGIGKTAAVKAAALELKQSGATGKVVTIIASQVLPNEVSGITMPVPEREAMEIFDHYRLSSLKDGDILFFDELLEADQLVLSACLTLIESRELMSGHKLPDILIVAATNPTIKPNMLKENIRQRFLWRKFGLDPEGTRQYIKRICGFDIGNSISRRINESGDEYNILTPRSLTKMAQWIASAEDADQAKAIASNINAAWNSTLGSELVQAYLDHRNDPEAQVRQAIRTAIGDCGVRAEDLENIALDMGAIMYDDMAFEQTDMAELMDVLRQLPEWDRIAESLSSMTLDVVEDESRTVEF
jgi:MoxR-like ATPase